MLSTLYVPFTLHAKKQQQWKLMNGQLKKGRNLNFLFLDFFACLTYRSLRMDVKNLTIELTTTLRRIELRACSAWTFLPPAAQ